MLNMNGTRHDCLATMQILMGILLFSLQVQRAYMLDLGKCRKALGMQSRDIPDDAITASSSYSKEVGPSCARINTEKNGGAWCPQNIVASDGYEYLQIDLAHLTVITMVETQGRFGNAQGREFTPEFLLEYQREDGGYWTRFRNKHGVEVFVGNHNTYKPVTRLVAPPIITKRIRFIPYSREPRVVCMRVEIYGCKWDDGVVSYEIKQGDTYDAGIQFYDFTYDGIIRNSSLSDGLGQLTDGETGNTNFRLDRQGLGMKGYEWVGWKNDTAIGDPGPVTLTFKFNSVRDFTSMVLHCNNYFSNEVRVFRQAVIHYSVGGKYFTQKKEKLDMMRDTVVEYARHIIIKMDHLVAKYIKIQLYYDGKWILISEVEFHSKPVMGDVAEETPPPSTMPTTQIATDVTLDINVETDGVEKYMGQGSGIENREDVKTQDIYGDTPIHKSEKKVHYNIGSIGIIVGASVVLIIVILAIALFI